MLRQNPTRKSHPYYMKLLICFKPYDSMRLISSFFLILYILSLLFWTASMPYFDLTDHALFNTVKKRLTCSSLPVPYRPFAWSWAEVAVAVPLLYHDPEFGLVLHFCWQSEKLYYCRRAGPPAIEPLVFLQAISFALWKNRISTVVAKRAKSI